MKITDSIRQHHHRLKSQIIKGTYNPNYYRSTVSGLKYRIRLFQRRLNTLEYNHNIWQVDFDQLPLETCKHINDEFGTLIRESHLIAIHITDYQSESLSTEGLEVTSLTSRLLRAKKILLDVIRDKDQK